MLNNFLQKARQRPELTGLTSTYNANNQQLKINFDRDKAQLLGLSTADVFNTLQSQFGSAISSQFSQFSRCLVRDYAVRTEVSCKTGRH